MNHVFQILIDGEIKTYHNFNEIPDKFDNVISFCPIIPDGPHTKEEHDEINNWNDKLKELMKRELK